MVRNIFTLAAILFFLSSCSSLKPLNFTSNKQVMAASAAPDAYTKTSATGSKSANSVKFIDDIAVTAKTVTPAPATKKATPAVEKREPAHQSLANRGAQVEEKAPLPTVYDSHSSAIENASAIQLKYSVLLNTEVEQLQDDQALLEHVDEWYGTRYRLGGTTKTGVDCSAFVQAVFLATYGINLPRTAREQYKFTERISRTELKEGDLLFFNTRGGVSHVGIYLRNNKFIHASTSRGVAVSDLFESYYLQRFIGAGRIEDKQEVAATKVN